MASKKELFAMAWHGINGAMNYYWVAGIIGLLSGIASGFFGVGGGIVMVPAMLFFLSPPVRDIKQAVGTSLLVIIPTALIGSLKHSQQNNIHGPTAVALIPTAIVGGFLGAWLTTQVASDGLRRAFGAFLIFVGLRLILFR